MSEIVEIKAFIAVQQCHIFDHLWPRILALENLTIHEQIG